MAKISWSVILGFVVPLILIVINLALGYGGLLVLILLLTWIGLAVFLTTPEDKSAT